MKKCFLLLIGLIPFLYSCGSVPADLKEYSPVAIMTVYSNPSVPWYDEKTGAESVEDGILSGAVNRFLNKKNPENTTTQERIDYASALLSERMRAFGLEVIDPSTNKELSAYKHAGKDFSDYLGNTVPAQGYEAFTTSNGKQNRSICKESGAKSVIYVNFRFQKVIVKDGVRDKGVAPRLVMSVFGTDSKGKMILNKEYKAVSGDYAELIKSSDWDKEKVVSLYPQLEEKLITQFLTDFVLAGDKEAAEHYKPTAIKVKTAAQKTGDGDNGAAQTGAEDAVLSEKKATAKKLLERGMTAQEASEITGLSQEEVEKLKQQE